MTSEQNIPEIDETTMVLLTAAVAAAMEKCPLRIKQIRMINYCMAAWRDFIGKCQ
ncbi:MAG: hypothetical protein ACP5I8_07705 [Phycisphaerae bacterium]